MTPNSDMLVERLEVCVHTDDTTLRVGHIVNVGRDYDAGYSLVESKPGLEGVITEVHLASEMVTVCVGGLCECYCDRDIKGGRIRSGSNKLGRSGGSSIQMLAIESVSSDVLGGRSSLPTGATHRAKVFITQQANYAGYFAVVPWGADAVRVLDGSGENDDTAGPVLINGESFTVAAKTIEYSTSGTTYIWLQATSTDSAINAPTIESGSSLPAYEAGKCKILLARIIAGRVVQEHTGPVQGIIWGDCES